MVLKTMREIKTWTINMMTKKKLQRVMKQLPYHNLKNKKGVKVLK